MGQTSTVIRAPRGPTARGMNTRMGLLSRKVGDLRIYLGAAPGVGKTYSMLAEAHRRMERGTDVVAAMVDTHGRRKVGQLLASIDVIPPLIVEHEGTEYQEIDVPALLMRRPKVVLVDDLAHTNAPGSRNPKRWQDVEELLNAGITVISTVNIQNLESVADLAGQITGVDEPDRIPDEVVRAADQIELVDITPEALRRRLAHGNIYPRERVDAALSNYFRPENLTALRQLALLWLADQVDAALEKYRSANKIPDTWKPRERVVVGVTGGPGSETQVRRASLIASRTGADLKVVHVVRGDGLTVTSAQQKRVLRDLAASLGATLHTVIGDDVAATLIDFARDVNATQLVVGTSRRSRLARFFDEGITATVVQRSGPLDVHVVTHEEAGTGISKPRVGPGASVTGWLAAVALPPAICALLLAVPPLGVGTQTALFVAGVLMIALLGGIARAALSAVLSGVLITYFLIEPRNSFAVAGADSALTTGVLLGLAIAVAGLVDQTARHSRAARRASQNAELLALFADGVLRDADPGALLERVRETYAQRSVSLLRGRTGEVLAHAGANPCTDIDEADTTIEIGDDEYWLLLAGPDLTSHDRRVLNAVAEQAVSLVKKRRQADEAIKFDTEAEKLRSSIQSAITHNLRTPLVTAKAAIAGAAHDNPPPDDTVELLAAAEKSVDELSVLVVNLLDSSCLATGAIRPELRPVDLRDAVEHVLREIGPDARRVQVDVDGTAVLADGELLGRVLGNLLTNSLRYGDPDGDSAGDSGVVRVTAGQVDDRVLIAVVDSGPGIPRGSEHEAFAPFQRLGRDDANIGVGLGLPVASGLVEAMGGRISMTETPGGGLTVEIDLPAARRSE